jgi:hypothetical protein
MYGFDGVVCTDWGVTVMMQAWSLWPDTLGVLKTSLFPIGFI